MSSHFLHSSLPHLVIRHISSSNRSILCRTFTTSFKPPPHQQQYQQHRSWRPAILAALGGGLATAGLILNTPLAPSISQQIDDNNELQIREQLDTLSELQKLRHSIEWEEFDESKYIRIRMLQAAYASNHLTRASLRGPGKLSSPFIFIKTTPNNNLDKPDRELVAFIHLGSRLCGHPGFAHGGLLATILDEALALTACDFSRGETAVTANLNVDYRKPVKVEQVVVIRGSRLKKEGRKTWVKARIETIKGELLVEATGLFIEPKW